MLLKFLLPFITLLGFRLRKNPLIIIVCATGYGLISIIYICYPIIAGLIALISRPVIMVTRRIMREIHFLEQFYIKLHNLYSFTSQMAFFVMSAVALNEIELSEARNDAYILLVLKTLLFYSVITYFVAKTRDIWATNQGRAFHNNWSFMKGICKIVVEWAKAVIVVFCLREQGISFKPKLFYIALTLSYYIFTERVFLDILQATVRSLNCEIFENLEHLYVPLVFNVCAISSSLALEMFLLSSTEHGKLLLAGSYLLIYIRVKDVYYNYWQAIKLEKQTYESFKIASEKELEEFDDICAVCLNEMVRARITPCNHFFHPLCLKECLKTSFLCPICKCELTTIQ